MTMLFTPVIMTMLFTPVIMTMLVTSVLMTMIVTPVIMTMLVIIYCVSHRSGVRLPPQASLDFVEELS